MAERPEILRHRREVRRYWERRRWLYNGVLMIAALAALFRVQTAPVMEVEEAVLNQGVLLFLAFLIVAANVCYSVAYLFEFFVVETRLEAVYLSCRWLVLLLGCLLGSVLAYAVTLNMLGIPTVLF